MASPVPDPTTALALERLRGVVGESFAEIKGSLALLVQRSDQADRALGAQQATSADHEKRLAEVERELAAHAELKLGPRMTALEERRLPHGTLAALAAGATIVAGVAAVAAVWH
jgi:hypothetical protein